MENAMVTEVAGWIGITLIVAAYFFISFRHLDSRGALYSIMNLLGAIGIAIDVFSKGAWPALILQIVWGIIALTTLFRWAWLKFIERVIFQD